MKSGSAMALTLAAAAFVAGCAGGVSHFAPANGPVSNDAAPAARPNDTTSLLKTLKKQVVIGSTVDPVNGAGNPYGLTVSPTSSGPIVAGDLLVCNFNAKSNLQGTGASIVALHPGPGSKPLSISTNNTLTGCDAIALGSDGLIWAAAMVANDNPLITASGALSANLKGKPLTQPWGQTFAQPPNGTPAYYETNAGDGSVVRISLGPPFKYTVVATGFPVNQGKPGTALAPSGLAYDPKIDTLYFADGMNDTVVALAKASTLGSGGVTATKNGMRFTGPNAKSARVIFAGKPLNGPISAALLPNGNLVIGNTLDPNGTNLLVEITPGGRLLATRNVDKGAAGALFGIVATGTSDRDTKIYFNDDNDNNLQVLEK